MVYVDKVHYTKDSYGNELYISEVMWTDSLYENAWKRCSKADMIRFINANPGHARTKYVRGGRWCDGEEIRVVDNSYLRTDNNNIKADNLENLPRY